MSGEILGSFCVEQLLMLPAMGGDAEKDFKKEGRMSRDFRPPSYCNCCGWNFEPR